MRPSRIMAVTKIGHEEWKTEESIKAIHGKLKMLFEELRPLERLKGHPSRLALRYFAHICSLSRSRSNGCKEMADCCKSGRKRCFCQTLMEREPVYMKIVSKITGYVIELYPMLKKFIEADGCLYTIMQKAIHGCIQASLLWYRLLKKLLEMLGYKMSEMDRCIF
jgi:hypothetical protein